MKDVTAQEARALLEKAKPGQWTVLDVRQAWEYEEFHLPGSLLIPLPELPDRLDEIDPHKPVLAYCRSGGRSRSAATLLDGEGREDVQNLLGGAMSWQGHAAFGPLDGGLEYLNQATEAQDVLLLGYGMEAFLQEFYERMKQRSSTAETRALYERLAGFEDRHMDSLYNRYASRADDPLSREEFDTAAQLDVAEGGVDPDLFVEENAVALKTDQDVVSMAMMFETQALDFYMRAARAEEDATMAELLVGLAREEQAHLKVLGTFMDTKPQGEEKA